MRKLLNNPWAVAVLALAALVVVGRALFDSPPAVARHGSPPEAGVDPVESPDETAGPMLSVAAALKAVAVEGEVRDPFALPARPETESAETAPAAAQELVERLRLSACWVQGSTVLLLLNGQVYRPGDRVAHARIECADVTGAWIEHPGARSFLAVGQELTIRLSPVAAASLSAP